MIEARVDTIVRGVECIGGGIFPEELAKREKRVREARSKPRYCENPDCRVLKLTGEKQRLRGLNGVITEKGAYRGVALSRVCSWCERGEAKLDQEPEEAAPEEKCVRGHSLWVVGRYASGECKECKREANQRRREEKRLERLPHRHGSIMLHDLDELKRKWGGSYPVLARAIGYKTNTLKSWAYLTCAAPPEAVEKLVGVLGCTVAELTGEAE